MVVAVASRGRCRDRAVGMAVDAVVGSVGIPGAPNKARRAACHMPLSNRLKPEGSPRKPENVPGIRGIATNPLNHLVEYDINAFLRPRLAGVRKVLT